MPRVVFMCGPAGSGKSHFARGLERDGLVRLSIDEDAWRRGFTTMPLPDEIDGSIERDLRNRLVGLVRDGRDVVLDLSLWSRQMRDDYRELLAPFGVVPETVWVQTPRDVALARIDARRLRHADDFHLSAELAASYYDQFEKPTEDEAPLIVVSGLG